MFDKILFDRNAFDRSVSSEGITATIISYGTFKLTSIMRTSLPLRTFSGSGNMVTGIVIQQNVGLSIKGEGELGNNEIRLRLPLQQKFVGSGSLPPGVYLRTPFSLPLTGFGALIASDKVFLYQHMSGKLSGSGSLKSDVVFLTFLESIRLSGSSALATKPILHLPLTIRPSGVGDMRLRRMGSLNESLIELLDINLLPGESVTIDTDLLQVLFGFTEDVSSITPESVFFELNPGENEISISTDSDGPLEVVAIWQNRWL